MNKNPEIAKPKIIQTRCTLRTKEGTWERLHTISKSEGKTMDTIINELLSISLLRKMSEEDIEYLVTYIGKKPEKLTFFSSDIDKYVGIKENTLSKLLLLKKEGLYRSNNILLMDLLRLHQLRDFINNNLLVTFNRLHDINIKRLILPCI